jgi:cytochrome c biogenesis protein CcmG/thiol:disulfide interchange protein DsbE
MENEEPIRTEGWVDEQIAALDPGSPWMPNMEHALAGVRERHRKASARRRAWGWTAAVASTACAVMLAVPATRAAVYRACTAACAVVWPSVLAEDAGGLAAPENPSPGSTAGAAVGKLSHEPTALDSAPAPDFALPDAAGKLIQLSSLKGQVVMLNFWATWCPPCKVEMPSFLGLQRKYKDRGFTIIAVSLDEGWEPVKPFAASLQPNFPIVLGSDELAQQFGGMTALPETLLIDREGIIRSRHAGLVSTSEYEQRIEELLAESRKR